MSDNSFKSDEIEKTGPLSKALKWLSVPATIASTFWFASTSVRNSTYDRLKSHGAFGNSKDSKKSSGGFIPKNEQKITNEIKSAIKQVKENKTLTKDLAEKVAPLDTLATKEITEHLDKFGLGKFTKQWKFAHKSTKQRALMDAFTAGGITLGAMFAIANTKTVSKVLIKREEDQQQNGPSI